MPNTCVVVLYDEDWHIGQVLDKNNEPDAEDDDDFLHINFMERKKQLHWPEKLDLLNVPKCDIICTVRAPTITFGCSSSRSVSFQLSQADIKKVSTLFNAIKAVP